MPALSIVSLDDGQLVFNEQGFQLLIELRAKSSKVVVLNIAGTSRQGRSFMLNLIARYFKHKGIHPSNAGKKLGGFDWGVSAHPITAGILVWDEIFEVEAPSGDRVEVVVMDSSGVFDPSSELRNSIEILLFTLLTSSIQIFNVYQDLNSQDFCNIQQAVRYAKSLSNGTADFNDLLFLVRDWPNLDQAPYGWEGGRRLLRRRMSEVTENGAFGEDPQKARREVGETFKSVRCFLMPHPGLLPATSSSFRGQVSELDAGFVTQLDAFLSNILNAQTLVELFPENRTRCYTFSSFLDNVRRFGKIFASGNVRDFGTFLDLNVRKKNAALCAKTVELYVLAMEGFLSSKSAFVPWEEHGRLHHNAMQNAMIHFGRSSKMSDDTSIADMQNFVQEQIRKQYNQFIERNRRASR